MIKLNVPNFSVEETIRSCKDGIIRDIELKTKLDNGLSELSKISSDYESKALKGQLFEIKPLSKNICADTMVAAGISKKDFINLYKSYFSKSGKPGRYIYDQLILVANEKCPFCGGIGRPQNLDHFLPKSSFPQLSIIPLNLIPICRDCNMDSKLDKYAELEQNQIIHPYLDCEKFFTEQWIDASVIYEEPYSIVFSACPPDNWSMIDKQRATAHFREFDLATRYSIHAADELTSLIDQRRNYLNNLTADQFQDHLKSNSNSHSSYFINHWKKVMYNCLKNDLKFCSHSF